jgi:hypothetical protein
MSESQAIAIGNRHFDIQCCACETQEDVEDVDFHVRFLFISSLRVANSRAVDSSRIDADDVRPRRARPRSG